jgi:sarcosine oxidase subunit delta
MQVFPCPFCGAREEHEFHFADEAGKRRPEPAEAVADADWADYLYSAVAPKGEAREIWVHLTCGTFFVMHRDTVSRAVLGSAPLLHGGSG